MFGLDAYPVGHLRVTAGLSVTAILYRHRRSAAAAEILLLVVNR